VRAAGNRVRAADLILDAPHQAETRMAAARSPKVNVEVRHGDGERADRILPAPATVLIDVGYRQRMQRLHQQGPQTRHRQG
jgi:hypothetical protein